MQFSESITVFYSASFLFLLLYGVMISAFIIGWNKIKPFESHAIQNPVSHFFSIIIAVRNEENNISALLSDLQNQDFPVDNYEVIIVDDNSTDKSPNIVKSFCKKYPQLFHQLFLSGSTGKKRALQKGIEHARGDVVVTTDADCRMSSGWL